MSRVGKRIFVSMAIGLGLILLTAVCAVLYLQTDSARAFLLAQINSAIPGSVACSQIDLAPLNGRLALHQATVADPAGKSLAIIDTLRLNLDGSALLRGELKIVSLKITKPHLNLHIDKTGRLGLLDAFSSGANPSEKKTGSGPSLNIVVDALELTQGSVDFQKESDASDQLPLSAKIQGIHLTADGNLLQRRMELKIAIDAVQTHIAGLKGQINGIKLNAQSNADQKAHLELRVPETQIAIAGVTTHIHDIRLIADADLEQQQATAQLRIQKAQKNIGNVKVGIQDVAVHAQGNLKQRQTHLQLNVAATQVDIAGNMVRLDDIHFTSDTNFKQKQANLKLNIKKPHLSFANVDIPLNSLVLDAEFNSERFQLNQFLASAQSAQLEIAGAVIDPLKTPAFDLNIDLGAEMALVRDLLRPQLKLTGKSHLDISMRGKLDNPQIDLQLTYDGGNIIGYPIDAAYLDCALQDLKLFFRRFAIKSNDPNLKHTGDMTMSGWVDLSAFFNNNMLAPTGDLSKITYQFKLDAQDFDIARFIPADQSIQGMVNGAISVKGQGIRPAHLNADASIDLGVYEVLLAPDRKPTDWLMQGEAHFKQQALNIKAFKVDGDQFNLETRGQWDLPSQAINAVLTLDAENLQNSLTLLGIKNIAGGLKLNAKVDGATGHPQIDMALKSQALRLSDFTIGDVVLDAVLDKNGQLRLAKLDIVNQESTLHGSGSIHLFKDRFNISPFMPSSLDIKLKNIALNDFFPKPVFHGRIDGTITSRGNLKELETAVALHGRDFGYDRYRAENLYLNGRIQGPWDKPLAPRTDLKASGLDLGFQKLEAVHISGDVDLEKVIVHQLMIVPRGDQSINANGLITYQGDYQIDLSSTPIDLTHIDVLNHQDIVRGKVAFNINGQGSFSDPGLQAGLKFSQMRLNAKKMDDFQLHLGLQDHLAEVKGRLNFGINAAYHLQRKTFQAQLDFDQTDLTPYFKLAKQPDLNGMATGSVTLQGSSDAPDQIKAKAAFTDIRTGFKQTAMVASRNLQVTFANNRIVVPGTTFQILDKGRISVQGHSQIDAATDLKIDGVLPLDLINRFTDALPDAQGNLVVQAKIKGSLKQPKIRAELNLEKIGFTVPGLMQPIQNLNGHIKVTPDLVTIDHIHGKMMKGRFNLDGQVELDAFRPVHADLRMNADALPVHLPDMLTLNLNTDLHFQGTPDKSGLTGEVVIVDGSYYQDIDLSLFKIAQTTRQKRREVTSPRNPITLPFLKNLALDIAVRRRNPFLVDNNLAYLEINPNLDINGTPNEPVISGQAKVESGEVTFNEKTFEIKRGIIEFLNPYQIEPTIDLQSETTIRKWTVLLNIKGTPDQLRFTLTSEPPEEQSDLLTLILTGQTAKELSQSGGKGSTLSSEMVAAYLGKSLGEDIGKMAGLDRFEVQSSKQGGENDTETVTVTVGKELSDRMGVTVKMESKAGESVERGEIEYKLLEHFKVKGYQDSRGAFGGELFFQLEFR